MQDTLLSIIHEYIRDNILPSRDNVVGVTFFENLLFVRLFP